MLSALAPHRSTHGTHGGLLGLVAHLRPVLLAAAFLATSFVVLLGLPSAAYAGGTVTLVNPAPEEHDGRWKLQMAVNYGSTPSLAHVPVTFVFTQTALYERALTDQSPKTPVLIKKPLSNQTPLTEGMEIPFSDVGTGKIYPNTKFDFMIRREHGFEAGEYDMKIKRSEDGGQIGPVVKLILKGDNKVIDRRAMVFSGEGKNRHVDRDPAEDKKDDADKKEEAAPDPAAAADDKGTDDKPAADGPAVPPVPPKQGGCGCRVAGEPGGGALNGLVALGLATTVLARRRRR